LMNQNMSKLYIDFFDKNRLCVWEKLKNFKDVGILGGGTALALQLNHRISYDFDVFCSQPIKKNFSFNITGGLSTLAIASTGVCPNINFLSLYIELICG